jgi:arylsulfatase A-like enzyme
VATPRVVRPPDELESRVTARPDIVLLVLDTQRADRLSCYGYPAPTSPHLDALAADATLFRAAMSPAQWTVPTHASLFTGLYPAEHGLWQTKQLLSEATPTLAERLRAGGYFTAAYCNNPLVGVVRNGLQRGFDSFLNYSGLLTSRPNQVGRDTTPLDRYRQGFKRLLAGVIAGMQDAFARSDLLLAFSFTPVMVPLWQTALNFKGNTGKALGDAVRLLTDRRGLAPGQPAFCFINLMGAHMPYRPPRRHVARFAPHVLTDRAARRYLRRFNSDIYGWLAPLSGPIDDERKATLDGMYNAEVASQDEQIGAFLRALRAGGRLDRTLLLVCADHGEHLGEKQLIGHNLSLYNELVRVPLLIRDPGGDLPRGATVDSVVSTRRLFHTALAAAGLADADEAALTLARYGASDPEGGVAFAQAVPAESALRLLLRRQPELVRARAFDRPRLAVWQGDHKLIETEGVLTELYDTRADPTEEVNLRDILPERVEALQEHARAFADRRPVGPVAARAAGADDPLLRRRLRDLGYLEE